MKQPNAGKLPKFLASTIKSSWRWLPGSIAAGAVILLFELGAWQQFEFIAYRQLFRLRGEQALDSRIITISIDDASVDKLGAIPWPHQQYVNLFKKLQPAKPAVIAITFPLSDKSDVDTTLAAEMKKSTVVLADDWQTRDLPMLSNAQLRQAAAQVGHVRSLEDSDGLVRSVQLFQRNDVAFGLAVVRASKLTPPGPDYPQDLWVNWRQAAPRTPNYSFSQVLDPNFDATRLSGKILIVGITAQGIDRLGESKSSTSELRSDKALRPMTSYNLVLVF